VMSAGGAIVGVPLKDVQQAVRNLVLWELVLTLTGVLLAALAGAELVRRTLKPLRAVAGTAHEVTQQPLSSGDISIEQRVPDRYTDPNTEVGQVGSALNTLLDHVDEALSSRHRSEQQVRQFVADASHELRTPLSTIHGYAELSRRTPDDAGQLSAAMAKVETEAGRMSALVEDLLLLARLDAGRPLASDEVDLTRLLLEAVADARVVGTDYHWRLDLPDEPVTINGDEQRLHQAVTNLLNNARSHTPPGTTITVGAVTAADGTVRMTVHDDGPGMAPELLPRAFERFTRGDQSRTRASGGAGLGLSLVAAIASAHHGRVEVASVPGDTTFTITLPA
jgi:two-component system OmpR family sensor kinase